MWVEQVCSRSSLPDYAGSGAKSLQRTPRSQAPLSLDLACEGVQEQCCLGQPQHYLHSVQTFGEDWQAIKLADRAKQPTAVPKAGNLLPSRAAPPQSHQAQPPTAFTKHIIQQQAVQVIQRLQTSTKLGLSRHQVSPDPVKMQHSTRRPFQLTRDKLSRHSPHGLQLPINHTACTAHWGTYIHAHSSMCYSTRSMCYSTRSI